MFRRSLLISDKLWKRAYRSIQNNLIYSAQIDHPTIANRIAIIESQQKSYTFGDLAKRTARIASLLHSKYHLKRGDRVLSRINKTVDGLALYLATLRLGAIYVPLNPAYTEEETDHFVKDSNPSLFVTASLHIDRKYAECVTYVVDSRDLYSRSASMKPEFDCESVEPNEIACICYTSGTTGLPKGAMLTHGGLQWNAQALVESWEFSRKDILLHMLPFYHVHGMFISLNCALFSQSAIIYRSKFDASDAIDWIPHSTVMMGVPTYYSRLMDQPKFDAKLVRNMRLFVCGSAPLSPTLWEKFHAKSGQILLERYGMTEAAVITSNTCKEYKKGSVGKVLKGGEIRIGTDGIVQTRSPSLFAGYWRNEQKTREEFTDDGFFISGDIGEIDNNGFLWLHGRAKDLIITGGLNVYPREVENALDSLPFVLESAAIGVPHDDLGEAVLAICVRRRAFNDNDQSSSSSYSMKSLRSKLANYKLPKRVIFVEALPRNSMGKVEKRILKEQFKDALESRD